MRVLIVDDEPLARDAIRVLLRGKEAQILPDARNGEEAVRAIRNQNPDIVFLDIQMPDLDGFGVIEQIGMEKMPVTIFVTAFDRHALRAFAVHALDYLLKPFDPERFYEAYDRAEKFVQFDDDTELKQKLLGLLKDFQIKGNSESEAQIPTLSNQYPDKLTVKTRNRIFFLKTEEIVWIQATGDYANLHGKEKSYLIRETMSELERKLDPQKFLRIHRSTIINIDFIKDISPLFKGEFLVTLINGREFKVSRGYQPNLQKLLDRYS